jgi:hypothetical protein
MFRWKDGTSVRTIGEVEAALAKLPAAIPAIAAYSFGHDVGVNDGNYEFAVVADFATLDDYIAYRDHPDHKHVIVDVIVPNTIADRSAVQFETNEK